MNRQFLRLTVLAVLSCTQGFAQKKLNIYHDSWIDFNKNGKKDVYEDRTQPIDKRIADLLSQMTLDEKTCQMATLYGYKRVLEDELPIADWKNKIWKDGIANIDEHLNSLPYHPHAVSKYSYPFSNHTKAINTVQKWFIEETRLGIPVDFTNEAIHGLTHDRATPLPAPIAIGSTWNKSLVYKAGEIAGREAKVLGYTNIYAPVLDVARDQRWGRIVETYGEDPFLIAELGKQMVLGIQNQDVAATVKHFAVYSVPKGGRDATAKTDPHVAPRELHQIFLYPFKRVIQEAKPMGIMSSYNDWDGVPITGSHYFLTQLLREQYGFNGYVVSDSRAVEFLYQKHNVAEDNKGAVKLAVEAGLNVRTDFSPPDSFILKLRELVNERQVSMKTIDDRVADVLRVKFMLGLFDNPLVEPNKADKVVSSADSRDFTLDLSRQALVLLKNEGNTLPLNKNSVKKILVTGPLAAATTHSISRYGPSNINVVSVLEGLRTYAAKNKIAVSYEKGCDIINPGWPETEIMPTELDENEKKSIEKAVAEARQSDVVIVALGEDEHIVGEQLSRTSLDLPGRQLELLKALHATGKPVILILINGRPLTINWAHHHIPSVIEAWFPGRDGGTALAETIFGENNPGGKLTATFPKTVGQVEYNFPFKPFSQTGQPDLGPNGGGRSLVEGCLYPFGHGLSYTQFEYSDLQLSPEAQRPAGEIQVKFNVRNTGKYAGDEVVQLYVKDKVSSVITYDSQLRGFERINLKPGEVKEVSFVLKPEDLALLDLNMKWAVEPGEFEVRIGSSSEDIRLKKVFRIVK
ncbi:MAG: glycoside hydrolase family 3 N-terminal domain-containing protein [Niabella sp.]